MARGDRPADEQAPIAERPRLRFQDLYRRRVHRILLVSSLYDSFILAEDGQLSEAILSQFASLSLSYTPDLTRVSTGSEALRLAREYRGYDMIVSSITVGDMNALELAQKVHAEGLGIPVVLLAYNNRELTDFRARYDLRPLERVFLWQGDVRILLAIVKYIEDRLNVPFDTGVAGVPAIIVVEDNVRFYSSFLPVIYTEVVKHGQGLVAEGLNLFQKRLRMRARPKILLCDTYEEAWEAFETYDEHVLGVISDIEFPWNEVLHPHAGVELAKRMRGVRADLPIMLQSSFPKNEELAKKIGASFLLKGSPLLLHQLREFIVNNFGFGPFVFTTPEGAPLDRADDLRELAQKLATVPVESIGFHGEGNHFSMWLKARGEYALAEKLRPRRVSDYATLEDLRRDLIESLEAYRRERDRVIVADFDRTRGEISSSISRIGGGSLGGKARGLAFVNRLLSEFDEQRRFGEIEVAVPKSVVLGTDVFDEFLDSNDLRDLAMSSSSDAEVRRRFDAAAFPSTVVSDLERFLQRTDHPLAVRSSGLLEDLPSQPFAGVYETHMVPNNSTDLGLRLQQLVGAVKRVYASTFSRQAKSYLQMTSYRLEEEKMAVILQRIVGRRHGSRFYPDFAGVARSHNFYPAPPMRAEDGIVAVCLGLGVSVVEGERCLRFSPRHPQHIVGFSGAEEALENSQREFLALALDDDSVELRRHGLADAERDGTLAAVGSTYSPDNDVIYDGVSRRGVRLVTFAPILKHGLYPLAELLDELLRIGSDGTSSPVEIEFAGNLGADGRPPEFGFLQMRPLAMSGESEAIDIGPMLTSDVVCQSAMVMGHGSIDEIRDVVVVDAERFDRLRSREAAAEVARFNAELQQDGAPYVLIGVGRWGSADPSLGIPVAWHQIAGARVIVEAGFKDMRVEPSQGTHFFQNLTSCNVGYFTVNAAANEGFVDWAWLAEQPARGEGTFARHLRFERPLGVRMSGHNGEGVIVKPGRIVEDRT